MPPARGSRDFIDTRSACSDRARAAAGQGQPHRRARLFDGDQAYILQNDDRRIVFAIPYEQRLHADRHHRSCPTKAIRRRCAISAEETDYLCSGHQPLFQAQHLAGRRGLDLFRRAAAL